MNEARTRKLRSDGERSRTAILRVAAKLATVEGLSGLSIAGLADEVGMSKSGLFAHFGSKEELQLATIDMAGVIFDDAVIAPTRGVSGGLERLQALGERFLKHVEEMVFPGGCFFASVLAEVDTHPGPVRDRALATVEAWTGELLAAVRAAQAEGDIDPAEDAEQLVFELDAFLLMANAMFVVSRSREPIEAARRAVERRLAAASPRVVGEDASVDDEIRTGDPAGAR
jgi:AcrR family transcriptional regulator